GGNAVVLASSSHDIDDIGFHVVDQRLPVRPPPKVRTEVQLSRATLQRYAGADEMQAMPPIPPVPVELTDAGVSLWAEVPGKGRLQLFAESETELFLKVMDAQVSMVRDASGDVTGLVLHQGGFHQPGRRLS